MDSALPWLALAGEGPGLLLEPLAFAAVGRVKGSGAGDHDSEKCQPLYLSPVSLKH